MRLLFLRASFFPALILFFDSVVSGILCGCSLLPSSYSIILCACVTSTAPRGKVHCEAHSIMTSNNILVVLAIWGQLVSGLAFGGPRATQDALEWGSGWSPAPTSAPDAAHELVKRGLLQGRQFASTILVGADQTCGYLSGSGMFLLKYSNNMRLTIWYSWGSIYLRSSNLDM